VRYVRTNADADAAAAVPPAPRHAAGAAAYDTFDFAPSAPLGDEPRQMPLQMMPHALSRAAMPCRQRL